MVPHPGARYRRAGIAPVITSVFATIALAQSPGLKVVIVEGQGAINNIQQHRAKEPVVQVTDANNTPIEGATVSFLLPDTGASGFFGTTNRLLTIQTDAKGQAIGHGLRPNSVAGRFQIRVTASYRGETASAMIAQINATPAGATKGGGSKKFLIIALIGGAAAGGAAAALGHKSGSPQSVASIPAGTVLVPGSPGFQPPH